MIFVLLSIGSAKAQGADTARAQKFEAGLQIYDLEFADPGYFFQPAVDPFEHYFASGAYCKIWKENRAWRLAFQRQNFSRDMSSEDMPPWFLMSDAASPVLRDPEDFVAKTSYGLFAGHQWLLSKTKLAPYYFVDLAFYYCKQRGVHTVRRWGAWGAYDSNEFYTNLVRQAGVANGVGLRLQLCRFMTLNFETQFTTYFQRLNDRNKGGRHDKLGVTLHPVQFTLGLYY